MARFLTAILTCLLVTSCIPTKKLTYLQEAPETDASITQGIRKIQPPYRFKVNDIVSVRIQYPSDRELEALFNVVQGEAGSELYYSGYSIDIHGNIRVPKIGEVSAIGKTADELRESIELELSKIYKFQQNYFVRVKLSGIKYTMTGEVTSPGQYTVLQNQINIVEAVSQGGGVPITGDLTDVRVIREINGMLTTFNADLTQKSVINSPAYQIQNNDMIIVKPLPQKAIGTGTVALESFTTIFGLLLSALTAIILVTTTR
ncbi:MAG: polysaccharide biosynthesis/export family protein [Nonlabens sp.]